MTLSYVLTVEPRPAGAVMTPEDVAQYIRLRLDAKSIIEVVSITGIESE